MKEKPRRLYIINVVPCHCCVPTSVVILQVVIDLMFKNAIVLKGLKVKMAETVTDKFRPNLIGL